MRTINLDYGAWPLSLGRFWEKVAPHCQHPDCARGQGLWARLRNRPHAVVVQGSRYCIDQCLERALKDLIRHSRSLSKRALAPHRIPLGLLLLSRRQLTPEQLRTALAAQGAAGKGKIGEWLQTLGFASEEQVTAALARQWSCPVLRVSSFTNPAGRAPHIPLTLLENFIMIPVEYVRATSTLHIAFGEGIDYGVLNAIERMLGCRTEPCMAIPSLVRQNLQTLSGRRRESEITFDRIADSSELARIIRSYCIRVGISKMNLAACGPDLWVRLFRPSGPPMDLLFRAPREVAILPILAPMGLTAAAV
jgi:hypothetical protein